MSSKTTFSEFWSANFWNQWCRANLELRMHRLRNTSGWKLVSFYEVPNQLDSNGGDQLELFWCGVLIGQIEKSGSKLLCGPMLSIILPSGQMRSVERNYAYKPPKLSLRFFANWGLLRRVLLILNREWQHMTHMHPLTTSGYPGRSRFRFRDTSPPLSGTGCKTLPLRKVHLPKSVHTQKPKKNYSDYGWFSLVWSQ